MKKLLPSLAVFLIAYTLIFLFMDLRANIYDEGLVLMNANRTMTGEVIHRDFYSPYGPGSYYVLALLFELLHPNFMVARLYGVTIQAGIVAITFNLLQNRCRWWIATCGAIVTTLWLLANPLQFLYPTFPCALLALFGARILLGSRGLDVSGATLCGACCGLSAYFRYDAGFFTMIAAMAALAITELSRQSGSWSRALRSVCAVGVGAALAFLPGAALYLWSSPLSSFWLDIIDFPIKYYPHMRGLPFPDASQVLQDPGSFGIYLPIFAVALAAPAIWADIAGVRRNGTSAMSAPLLLGLLTIILYYKGIVRVSTLHMMLSIIPAIALFFVLVERWWKASVPLQILAGTLLPFVGFSAALAAEPVVKLAARHPELFAGGRLAAEAGLIARTPDRTCTSAPAAEHALLDPDDARIARFLYKETKPQDRILVGLDRHDKVFVNALFIYFASDRAPGTHWAEYDPGLQTQARTQNSMIQDLIRNDVRYVVRDSRYDGVMEPNDSAKSSGIHVLDDYIASHYKPVAKTNSVEIWARNDVPTNYHADDIPECGLEIIRQKQ